MNSKNYELRRLLEGLLVGIMAFVNLMCAGDDQVDSS